MAACFRSRHTATPAMLIPTREGSRSFRPIEAPSRVEVGPRSTRLAGSLGCIAIAVSGSNLVGVLGPFVRYGWCEGINDLPIVAPGPS